MSTTYICSTSHVSSLLYRTSRVPTAPSVARLSAIQNIWYQTSHSFNTWITKQSPLLLFQPLRFGWLTWVIVRPGYAKTLPPLSQLALTFSIAYIGQLPVYELPTTHRQVRGPEFAAHKVKGGNIPGIGGSSSDVWSTACTVCSPKSSQYDAESNTNQGTSFRCST